MERLLSYQSIFNTEELTRLFLKSVVESLVEEGFAKAAARLTKKMTKSEQKLTKAVNKFDKSKTNSSKKITKQLNKIDRLQKEVDNNKEVVDFVKGAEKSGEPAAKKLAEKKIVAPIVEIIFDKDGKKQKEK